MIIGDGMIRPHLLDVKTVTGVVVDGILSPGSHLRHTGDNQGHGAGALHRHINGTGKPGAGEDTHHIGIYPMNGIDHGQQAIGHAVWNTFDAQGDSRRHIGGNRSLTKVKS